MRDPLSFLSARSRALAVMGLLLGLLASACGGGGQGRNLPGPSGSLATGGGDGIPPVDVGRKTLFVKGNTAPMDFRPGSRDLVQAVDGLRLDDEGLQVTAIKTTEDASGVFLVEDAPELQWGSLLSKGQAEVFVRFRADPGLGRFLILVTDVVVHRLQDPIVPTAYRWDRAAVESYAECGMPADTSDPCRQTFYRAATTVVLALAGGPNPGK